MARRSLAALIAVSFCLISPAAYAVCSSPAGAEGEMMYNYDYHVVQFCNGTNWMAVGQASLSSSGCPAAARISAPDSGYNFDTSGIRHVAWGDATYIYGANNNKRVRAYSFNGTSISARAESAVLAANIGYVTGGPDTNANGAYIYVAAGASGIHAFSYNGSTDTWSGPITYDTPGTALGIWTNGSYIFVADGSAGVEAFTFDGATWSLGGSATYDTPGTASAVWGDGTYMYVADQGSGTRALTWDGTSWTSVGTVASGNSAKDVTGANGYIYVADTYAGLKAYSFNGTSFTLLATYNKVTYVDSVEQKDGVIYALNGYGIDALKFDGSAFNVIGHLVGMDNGPTGLWLNSNYAHYLDAYSGFQIYPACH